MFILRIPKKVSIFAVDSTFMVDIVGFVPSGKRGCRNGKRKTDEKKVNSRFSGAIFRFSAESWYVS
jgi:hypothetical protein